MGMHVGNNRGGDLASSAESTNSPHVTLSGQCAIPSMHKCTIALFEWREEEEEAALPNVGNFEKQTRLSRQVWPPLEFCAQARAQKRGPLGEFPMRRQNPLLSFSSCSARSLLPTSLPPSPVSNGIPTAPLFLLRAAVTKKSVQTVSFPVAAAAAATVCAAQIPGSLALGRWATRHRRRPRPRPPRQVS